MKFLIAALLVAASPALVIAQTAQQPAKPAARPAARPAAKPAQPPAARPQPAAAAATRMTSAAQQAIEESVPMEEPDPTIKLSAADLEVAKKIFVGDIPCELGAGVKIRALRREGFFLVTIKNNRFVMHPVESRTGAIRMEDPIRGAMWLQLGNKSMLMSQKLGQRLADECQSPDQVTFAEQMKGKPPINLLEPAPAPAASPGATEKSGPN